MARWEPDVSQSDNGQEGENSGEGSSGGENEETMPSAYSIYYSTTNNGQTTYETVGKTENGDMWYLKHEDWDNGEFDGEIIRKKDNSEEYFTYNKGILKYKEDSNELISQLKNKITSSTILFSIWSEYQNSTKQSLPLDITVEKVIYTIYSLNTDENAKLYENNDLWTFDAVKMFNTEYDKNDYVIARHDHNYNEDRNCKFPYMRIYDKDPTTTDFEYLGNQHQFQLLKWNNIRETFDNVTYDATWEIESYQNFTDYIFFNSNSQNEHFISADESIDADCPLAYFIYHVSVSYDTEITLKATVTDDTNTSVTKSLLLELIKDNNSN